MRHKSQLLFVWLAELVRCRSILDAVEDLHGPDLLCWTSNFFINEAAARCRDGVGRLHTSDRGERGNGVHPRQPQARSDPPSQHLRQTQSLDGRPGGDGRGRPFLAADHHPAPGEMSLDYVRVVHGSPPDPPNDRRIGFAIRYIPTIVAQLAGEDSASLVRGEDPSPFHAGAAAEPRSRPGNSWPFTAPSPSATPGSSIAAPTSPATTSRRRSHNAAEPSKAHTWACGFMYALGQGNSTPTWR